jgi:hypothetical protein
MSTRRPWFFHENQSRVLLMLLYVASSLMEEPSGSPSAALRL